jgi:hypothetical protein
VDGEIQPVPHWFAEAEEVRREGKFSYYRPGEGSFVEELEITSDGASRPTVTFPEGDLYETQQRSVERFGKTYRWRELKPKTLLSRHIITPINSFPGLKLNAD